MKTRVSKKRLRCLAAAALLLPTLLQSASANPLSEFRFKYPASPSFETINRQFEEYPYDLSLPDTYDVLPDIANPEINARIGGNAHALEGEAGRADREALAGSLSQATLDNALNASNFMRVHAGLRKLYIHTNDTIGGYQWRAQAGAALLAELGTITHDVSGTAAAAAGVSAGVFGWAKAGPGGSNLVAGSGVANKLVNAFMPDLGNDRTGLSHRSFFLNPGLSGTGFGAANFSGTVNQAGGKRGSAVAMFVTYYGADPDGLTAVLWPSAKQPIETFRTTSTGNNPYGGNPWSFFLNANGLTVNQATLKVTLTCDGKPTDVLALSQLTAEEQAENRLFSIHSNPLKQVIGFRPHVAYAPGDKVNVTIEGIEDSAGLAVPVNYDVHFFKTGTTPYPILTETVIRRAENAASLRLLSDCEGTLHYLLRDEGQPAPTTDEVLSGTALTLGSDAAILELAGLSQRGMTLYYVTTSTTGSGKTPADALANGEMSAVKALTIPEYESPAFVAYTLAYDWGTDVPAGQALPSNDSAYLWEADARAAADGVYTASTTVRGTKNSKTGTWAFSGWDSGTLDADTGVITFRGAWTFAPDAPSIAIPAIVCKAGKAIQPVPMETVNLEPGGTWTAENLPAGLSIDPATGVISGTAATAGLVSALKVTYTDPGGNSTVSAPRSFLVWDASAYVLTLETNGGTYVPGTIGPQGMPVDDLAAFVTTREGYTFDGWCLDAQLTTPVSSIVLDKDITLYAKWTPVTPPVEKIVITFAPENGSPAFTEEIDRGAKVTVPPQPRKDGYTFKGWYTAATGGSAVDLTVMTFIRDTTLYAQWELKSSGIDTGNTGNTGNTGSSGTGSPAFSSSTAEKPPAGSTPTERHPAEPLPTVDVPADDDTSDSSSERPAPEPPVQDAPAVPQKAASRLWQTPRFWVAASAIAAAALTGILLAAKRRQDK